MKAQTLRLTFGGKTYTIHPLGIWATYYGCTKWQAAVMPDGRIQASSWLMRNENRKYLRAIIGHELGHIANGDHIRVANGRYVRTLAGEHAADCHGAKLAGKETMLLTLKKTLEEDEVSEFRERIRLLEKKTIK